MSFPRRLFCPGYYTVHETYLLGSFDFFFFSNLVIGICRYASEIDGECVPITAPDGGERVYAKFCRALGDEEVKKLDVNDKSHGIKFSFMFPKLSLKFNLRNSLMQVKSRLALEYVI